MLYRCASVTCRILSDRRALGHAYATLYADLATVILAKEWYQVAYKKSSFELDVMHNIIEPHFLSSLSSYLSKRKNCLEKSDKQDTNGRHHRIVELYQTEGRSIEQVSLKTWAKRLRTIKSYILWLLQRGKQSVLTVNNISNQFSVLSKNLEGYHADSIPEGLSKIAQNILLEVITPTHPANPWKSKEERIRNELIVRLLLETGMRIGELLSLEISDVNFTDDYICIKRKQDLRKDPRSRIPKVKRKGRELNISSELTQKIHEYVLDHRPKCKPYSNRHNYLIINHRKGRCLGQPLSIDSVSKIFDRIKLVDESLCGISPHILRHTYNDNLSELFDNLGISPEEEVNIRTYNNGWVLHSKMPGVYTRRHTREKAREVTKSRQDFVKEHLLKAQMEGSN